MKVHRLKTWPPYFQDTLEGRKNFELRLNDHDFKIGDFLLLEEWDPQTKKYTGRVITKWVGYILKGAFGLPENMVIMQLHEP